MFICDFYRTFPFNFFYWSLICKCHPPNYFTQQWPLVDTYYMCGFFITRFELVSKLNSFSLNWSCQPDVHYRLVVQWQKACEDFNVFISSFISLTKNTTSQKLWNPLRTQFITTVNIWKCSYRTSFLLSWQIKVQSCQNNNWLQLLSA